MNEIVRDKHNLKYLEIVKEWLQPSAESNQVTLRLRGFTLDYIEQLEAKVKLLETAMNDKAGAK